MNWINTMFKRVYFWDQTTHQWRFGGHRALRWCKRAA